MAMSSGIAADDILANLVSTRKIVSYSSIFFMFCFSVQQKLLPVLFVTGPCTLSVYI